MIDDAEIRKDIIELNRLYQANIGNDTAKYYSKLAILEVCGWIEQSIDTMVHDCMTNHIQEAKNVEQFVYLVLNTSSFEYEHSFRNHFRDILLNLLGLINLEKMERILDQNKFIQMKSSLGSLKQLRDSHAHTFIPGTTAQFTAPSSTKAHFENVYQGLRDINNYLETSVT